MVCSHFVAPTPPNGMFDSQSDLSHSPVSALKLHSPLALVVGLTTDGGRKTMVLSDGEKNEAQMRKRI